jgi:superfamily I DNA/RNA helicase
MTMHASKGLEFPVVALAGVSGMPAEDCAEPDEARLFYVAATRATDVVIIPVAGDSGMGARLRSNDHRV